MTTYKKQTDQIMHLWLEEALRLEPGEELFFRCDSKKERNQLHRRLLREQRELALVDPHGASSVIVLPTHREGYFQIRIIKRSQSLLVAKKVLTSGEVLTVSLIDKTDRKRGILLMISDGYNEEEIDNFIEPPLTEGERKEYFG